MFVLQGTTIGTKADLEKFAAGMSRLQLQKVYDSIPGAPVTKRLRNRPTAIERIWAVAPGLLPDVAEPPHSTVERNHRSGTKRERLIEIIRSGATIEELCEELGWQRHTVRGLLSTLNKSGFVKIESSKTESGKRMYRLSQS